MILIDDGNTELGRALRASLPEGAAVQSDAGEYVLSAYPSVVVDVPAYMQGERVLNADGGLLGMTRVEVAAHQEVVRLPASWDAVAEYVSFVTARAAANPVSLAE
jgi:hypothetical protein